MVEQSVSDLERRSYHSRRNQDLGGNTHPDTGSGGRLRVLSGEKRLGAMSMGNVTVGIVALGTAAAMAVLSGIGLERVVEDGEHPLSDPVPTSVTISRHQPSTGTVGWIQVGPDGIETFETEIEVDWE